MMQNIVPFLWYSKDAPEAAKFYASIVPNSRVDSVTDLPVDSPSGPASSVKIVEFTLLGRPFSAMTAGPLDEFNHAISLLIECDTQEEIDRLWDALVEGGGKHEQCGWLRDKYGVFWQICPKQLTEMMKDKDRAKAKRVALAMMEMVKLDIAALQKAYDGK